MGRSTRSRVDFSLSSTTCSRYPGPGGQRGLDRDAASMRTSFGSTRRRRRGRQVSRTRRQRTAGPFGFAHPSRWLSAAVATGVVSSSRRTVRSTGSCSPRRGPEYPRSDSRPDRGGRFQHSPARSFEGTQQYVERTTVLETTFDTADGTATIRVTEGGADGNPSRRPPSTARTDNGGSTGSRLRRLAVRTDVMEWQSSTASVRYRRLPR